MAARQLLARVGDRVRDRGLAVALYQAHRRAFGKVASLDVLRGMAVTVGDVPEAALFEASGFEGRFAGQRELAVFAQDPAYDLTEDFVAEAVGRGDRCYALFDGGTLAAYGWYTRRPTPIDDRFVLHFDPAFTYMYKGFTLPAYRGQRLHAAGMYRALRAFTDRGQRGLVSYVDAGNAASLKSVARMGYRVFGALCLLAVGDRRLSYASPGCRAFGFRAQPA